MDTALTLPAVPVVAMKLSTLSCFTVGKKGDWRTFCSPRKARKLSCSVGTWFSRGRGPWEGEVTGEGRGCPRDRRRGGRAAAARPSTRRPGRGDLGWPPD